MRKVTATVTMLVDDDADVQGKLDAAIDQIDEGLVWFEVDITSNEEYANESD